MSSPGVTQRERIPKGVRPSRRGVGPSRRRAGTLSNETRSTPTSVPPPERRRSTPTTGMRGGLGRTLLTAFLILAILPLSTITWYTTQRERQDIQALVTAKLNSTATMAESHVRHTVEGARADLALLAELPTTYATIYTLTANLAEATSARERMRNQMQVLQEHNPAFRRLAVIDETGNVLVSTAPHDSGGDGTTEPLDSTADSGLVVFQPITDSRPSEDIDPSEDPLPTLSTPILTGWLNPGDLLLPLPGVSGLGKTGKIYLVDAQGVAWPQAVPVSSPGIEAALAGQDSAGLYADYAGVPVIGVYRWLGDLGLALVAEQAQEEAFAPNDTVTAAVVGATLAVALVTAVIAAIVTRQITRPIVQLTETALRIAEGDMDQQVPVTSRDEIGILAYVFNEMTAELKTLYDDLEEKVAQRTALLQKANYQIQRRAIQLATTVEVSQAATSILDPAQLLRQVVLLIHDRFAYSYVGIYLIDQDPESMSRAVASLEEDAGGSDELAAMKAQPVPLGDGSAVGQAALRGEPCIIRWDDQGCEGGHTCPSPSIQAEAALPLRMGDETIGVLDILTTDEGDFNADDVSVLQNVANQITIALQNAREYAGKARAYADEREAAKRLRELDRSKRRFLANMSHELRTPLTNIIGFSHLLLNGLDGPLTQQQSGDIEIIHHNSQHLLGLINDLLDITHIEAGLMELELREVDMANLIRSVSATAGALLRDRDREPRTQLRIELAPNLPMVQADATRIRQVLLRLLANAVKFTPQGTITVHSWRVKEEVLVSVSDTGIGIRPGEEERIFERFEQGQMEDGRRPNGAGLGLALSREFVEMHGGRIWVESEVGKGSTFTFSLPIGKIDT